MIKTPLKPEEGPVGPPARHTEPWHGSNSLQSDSGRRHRVKIQTFGCPRRRITEPEPYRHSSRDSLLWATAFTVTRGENNQRLLCEMCFPSVALVSGIIKITSSFKLEILKISRIIPRCIQQKHYLITDTRTHWTCSCCY